MFEDVNNDGVQDPGEVGVAGVDVTLTGIDDLGNVVEVTVQTDVDGTYMFTDVVRRTPPGTRSRKRNLRGCWTGSTLLVRWVGTSPSTM